MTIIHIVMFKLKASLSEAEVQEVCTDMLSLKNKCLHPTTNKPYILSASGGKDNSPEGLQNGLTHAFVVEFANASDRDYYTKDDPAHQAFVKTILPTGKVEKALVVDYEPGKL